MKLAARLHTSYSAPQGLANLAIHPHPITKTSNDALARGFRTPFRQGPLPLPITTTTNAAPHSCTPDPTPLPHPTPSLSQPTTSLPKAVALTMFATATLFAMSCSTALAAAKVPTTAITTSGAPHSSVVVTHSEPKISAGATIRHNTMPTLPPSFAAIGGNSQMIDRMLFLVAQASASNVLLRAVLLFGMGLPLVYCFGWIYHKVSGVTLKESLLKMYGVLYRVPGINVLKEPNTASLVVANVSFFFGFFVFAVVLGIIGEEVKSLVKAARAGKHALEHEDHIVVLGWNDQCVALVKELALEKHGAWYDKAIIVLANKPKAEMDDQLSRALASVPGVEYHTRTGDPRREADLKKVSAGTAANIALLHPAKDPVAAEADKATACIALSNITSAKKRSKRLEVVVQHTSPIEPHNAYLTSLRKISGPDDSPLVFAQIPMSTTLNRLVSATATQPGLMRVWSRILQQGKDHVGLAIIPAPLSTEGKTFQEVRRRYAGAGVLWCVIRGSSESTLALHLAPPEDFVVQRGDRLGLLSRKNKCNITPTVNPDPHMVSGAAASLTRATKRPPPSDRPGGGKKLIVAGWPPAHLPDLVQSLDVFSPAGTQVTLLLPQEPENLPKTSAIKLVSQVHRHPTSVEALTEGGIKTADCVLLGPPESAKGHDGDSLLLASIVQVQDAILSAGCAKAPHVVSQVASGSTYDMAKSFLASLAAGKTGDEAKAIITAPELLQVDPLMSAFMTQVSAQRESGLILKELLLSREGHELYLRSPALLHFSPGETVTFAEISETARRVGEVATGWVTAGGQISLAPAPGDTLTVGPGDSIITIAEDYRMCRFNLKE